MATARSERSRDAIRGAAAELFTERGYANTSVRDIAALAEVDPALIIRYFGSKEELFIETMRGSAENALHLDGPIETLGERLVRHILDTDQTARATFLALVRASDTGKVGAVMRVAHEEGFVAPLLHHLEGPDAETRARLVAAMVGGLMYSLWIAQDEKLTGLSVDELVAAYVPALQVLIDGE